MIECPSKHMPQRKKSRVLFQRLFWHTMMGTCVGLAGAVLLKAVAPHAFNVLVNAPYPPLSTPEFLGLTALVFGAGATLTGMLLLLSDSD
jgi:hypothetical protein